MKKYDQTPSKIKNPQVLHNAEQTLGAVKLQKVILK